MPTLIECPACKGNVSDQAPTCPHCGHPLASEPEETNLVVKGFGYGIGFIIAAVFLLFLFLLYIANYEM